ncbi:endonuclease domain-containing protein [Microbacterium sp. C7(2022)]|uniref:endonuclease domain-containing protein n=1 Tax=Microbacterium sp. C7(2022) TaxID=2992759 RepID=UPI00237B94C7|nr:DUF559 domain-containing protein [Microbacterium sp. C7(2022)]MDE0547186.1 DUF559 domain-containing protein [Microbacterium sp. C7(2022)]
MTRRSPAQQIAELTKALRHTGGVMRASAVTDLGFSPHCVRAAMVAGAVTRPRRGWLADTEADPELIAAARAGVVLTCITEARRRGLWVLDELEKHVAAPARSGRVAADPKRAHVHWCEPAIPRHPGSLVDPIENVLAIVAACQPYEKALVIWESALRQGLVDRQVLAGLRLPPQGRRLLKDATPWSDSGLETLVIPRLLWLRLPIRPQIWIAGHRVDFLIGDRLVLQIDGKHHVGRQRAEDIAHDAHLRLLGYTVVRVSYGQIVERWHEVQDQIMRAVAQGLHRAS